MKNKRTVDTRANIRVITLNNFITAAGLENTSLKARKLLYIAIAQCKMNDDSFYEYTLPISDFAKLMGIDPSNVYQEADKVTDELMHGFIKYIPEGEKDFTKFQLFKRCKYQDNSAIEFQLSEEMTPVLLNIKKNFSQPLLNDFLRMKSNYSIEIWHLIQREMSGKKPGVINEIEFELSLEELRQVTGTTDKLTQLVEFKKRVLDKALREIFDNCGVKITYTNIKHSRTVIGFHFTAVSFFHVDESKIPQRTKDKMDLFDLKRIAQTRPWTEAEQMEYDRLIYKLSLQDDVSCG